MKLKRAIDPAQSLALQCLFGVASAADSERFHFGLVMALAEVRCLIGEFPDHEVDGLFIAEVRRRIDCNGERLIAVGQALGRNLILDEDADAQAVANKLR